MSRRTRVENPYLPAGGLNADAMGLSMGPDECADVLNLRVRPEELRIRPGSRQLGSNDPGVPLHFETYRPPNADAILFAFCTDDIQKYDEGSDAWVSVLDAGATTPNASYWSVTGALDGTEGYTLVAAASDPPNLGEEEDDQARRVMYYYDASAGTFKDLELTQWVRVLRNVSTMVINTTSETGYFGTTLSSGEQLQGGTAAFYTEDNQLIATASKISDVESGKDVWRIAPLDTTLCTGGFVHQLSDDPDTTPASGDEGWYFELDMTSAGVTKYSGKEVLVDFVYQAATSYKPRFVAWFHNRLVMANTYEDSEYLPWRVRWGEVQDIFMATQLNYFDTINQSIEPVTGMILQGPYLKLVKPDSILRVYHTEAEIPENYRDELVAFNFQTEFIGGGSILPRCLLVHQNLMYLVGADDIYAYDGNSMVPLTQRNGYTTVRRALLGTLDLVNCWRSFAVVDTTEHELRFYLLTQNTDWPNTCYVFSLRYGTWTKYQSAEMTAIGKYRQEPFVVIDDLVGTIDQQEWIINSTEVESAFYRLVFGLPTKVWIEDKTLNTDGGYESEGEWVGDTAIDWHLVTRDFIYRGLASLDRTVRVKMELYGSPVQVGIAGEYTTNRTDFEQWQTLTPTLGTRVLEYYPDYVSRTMRLYLYGSGSTTIRWMQPHSIELLLDGGYDSGR